MNLQFGLLERLQQHKIADAAQCATLADLMSGASWLTALQACAAWLAAVLIGYSFDRLYWLPHWPFALLLVGLALWLFWRWRSVVFLCHLALGCSLAGQILLAHNHPPRWVLVSLALVLALPRSSLVHRVLCLLLAAGYAYDFKFSTFDGLFGLVLIAAAITLWLPRRQWALKPHAGHFLALAHSTGLAGLVLLVKLESHLNIELRRASFSGSTDTDLAYGLGAAFLWLAVSTWLAWRAPAAQRLWLLGAAIVLSLGAYIAPALVVSLALMLAAFHACQRVWCVLALVAACGFLGLLYYNMQHTLLMKSILLAITGAVLLGVAWRLRDWQKGDA